MSAKKSQTNSILHWPQQAYQFMFEARDELRKVSWPSRRQTIRYTIIVVIASLATGAIVGTFDYVLTILLELTI